MGACAQVRQEEKAANVRQKGRMLIFVNKIKTAKFLKQTLAKHLGAQAGVQAMSSALPQQQREQLLMLFRCGRNPILIATDVAGRGLDVRGLEYVVNYDFPTQLQTYVHRVGRTGRQGASGHAFSFLGRHLGKLAPPLLALLQVIFAPSVLPLRSNEWRIR